MMLQRGIGTRLPGVRLTTLMDILCRLCAGHHNLDGKLSSPSVSVIEAEVAVPYLLLKAAVCLDGVA